MGVASTLHLPPALRHHTTLWCGVVTIAGPHRRRCQSSLKMQAYMYSCPSATKSTTATESTVQSRLYIDSRFRALRAQRGTRPLSHTVRPLPRYSCLCRPRVGCGRCQGSSTLSRRRYRLLVVGVGRRARLEEQRRDILLVVTRGRRNAERAILLCGRHEMVENDVRWRRQDGVVVDRLGRLGAARVWCRLWRAAGVRVQNNLGVSGIHKRDA